MPSCVDRFAPTLNGLRLGIRYITATNCELTPKPINMIRRCAQQWFKLSFVSVVSLPTDDSFFLFRPIIRARSDCWLSHCCCRPAKAPTVSNTINQIKSDFGGSIRHPDSHNLSFRAVGGRAATAVLCMDGGDAALAGPIDGLPLDTQPPTEPRSSPSITFSWLLSLSPPQNARERKWQFAIRQL